jgi:hypothetical protein
MNPLLEFLIRRSEPCEKLVCTTCGGIVPFLKDLDTKVTGSRVAQLQEMDIRLARKLQGKKKAIRLILKGLSDTDRHKVVERWIENTYKSAEFAVPVLIWTEYGSDLPDQHFTVLIKNAIPKLLLNRGVRDKVRRVVTAKNVEVPETLAAAFASDDDADKEGAEASARKTNDRKRYFDSLVQLPFNERAKAICADASIDPYRNWREWQPWASSWTYCTEEELSLLRASDIQGLIDLCEDHVIFRSSETLRKLYDRRHFLRLREIDAIRVRLAGMDPRDQLDQLLHDETVPIEHFPPELTKLATREWFVALEPEVKRKFRTMLEACRLKIWKRALNAFDQ